MLDLFSWQHILILLAVALVVVGPKDLPKLMNMAGKWVGKARTMVNEFKKSFDDMARQTELDELRKEIGELRSHAALAEINVKLDQPVETNMRLTADMGVGPESGAREFASMESVLPFTQAAPEPSRK